MSFLSFLGFQKLVEDGAKALDPTPQRAQDSYPNEVQKRKPKMENKEFYRVGRTEDGMTTLTMIGNDGYTSMTLTMNQSACKQMIRMLESTFDLEQPTEETTE